MYMKKLRFGQTIFSHSSTKKCFQGCKKCTVVKQVVNKDLYKNPAQILFFSALLQTFNNCLIFTLDCALGSVRGQPDINSLESHGG